MFSFNEHVGKVTKESFFSMEDYCIWGSAMILHDGIYYLIFSRWPKEKAHQGWLTDSEIAIATSDSAFGPFEYKKVILKGDHGDGFDADSIHNPTVIEYEGRYYLYYMGNYGNGEYWVHRNNQRIGVAVATHPLGPWERMKEPVIDTTEGEIDHLLTSNPTATVTSNNEILMVYKAVGDGPMPKGGSVICAVAKAAHPLGPFKKSLKPQCVNPENNWSVEDPFLWEMDNKYYLLAKDFQGYFTKAGKGHLALFESVDGEDFYESRCSLAMKREVILDSGEKMTLKRLERPFIFFEDGKPKALLCAGTNDEDGLLTFNVQIPLVFD